MPDDESDFTDLSTDTSNTDDSSNATFGDDESETIEVPAVTYPDDEGETIEVPAVTDEGETPDVSTVTFSESEGETIDTKEPVEFPPIDPLGHFNISPTDPAGEIGPDLRTDEQKAADQQAAVEESIREHHPHIHADHGNEIEYDVGSAIETEPIIIEPLP